MIEKIAANIRSMARLSTIAVRRKPDYMIIGAQKSGTSSLFNMLSQHPQIKNPRNKEMHYFDGRDVKSERTYRSLFPISFTRLTGEATPIYMYYPGVAERVKQTFPRCRFIVILRNPVDRAYSHYQMRFRRGKEPLSFEDAISAEQERLRQARELYAQNPKEHNHGLLSYSYCDRGLYLRQLEPWFSAFGRQQFHVLSFEDFVSHPQEEYRRICEFLQIADYPGLKPESSNSSTYSDMLPATRRHLEQFYLDPNRRLFEAIARDFKWNDFRSH